MLPHRHHRCHVIHRTRQECRPTGLRQLGSDETQVLLAVPAERRDEGLLEEEDGAGGQRGEDGAVFTGEADGLEDEETGSWGAWVVVRGAEEKSAFVCGDVVRVRGDAACVKGYDLMEEKDEGSGASITEG